MSVAVRVSQLSFETPVTSDFANVLASHAESVQTITEKITTFSAVVVTAISLEIPVAQVVEPPEPIVQPGESAPSAWVGGASVEREKLLNFARSEQTIDESIIETFVTYATSTQSVYTLIHQKNVVESVDPAPPIIGRIPAPDIVKFETTKAHEVVVSDQVFTGEQRRQREEDELILLGVLG